MEAILESTSAGTWEWNVQTGETVFNERWAEIAGYTLAELAPVSIKTCEALAHPEDFRHSGELLARHFAGELAYYDCDCRIRHKDGRWVWVRDHGKLVSRTPDGQPLWMSGTHIDITEREQLEEKLTQQLTLTQSILHTTPGFLVFKDRNSVYVEVNPAFCQFLGKPREEIIGKTDLDLFPPQDAAMYVAGDSAVMETGNPESADWLVSGEERKRWLQVTKNAVRDADGKINGVLCSVTDVTERKRMEDALWRNNKDLRESQRISHVGSWRLDVATNQVVWTEELYNMYGFDPSAPPPPYTEHMKLFTPESWERLSTALARTRETGIPYTLELETVREDGSNGWIWVRGEADVDSTGKTVGLWGAAQDITERKHAEKALRRSESEFRNAFEHSAIGMALVSPEGKFLRFNRRVCDIVGYDRDELMRKTFQDITHPDDLNANLDFVRRMLAGEIETYQMEKRYFHKDGHIVWVLLAVSLVWDDHGAPLHFISQIQDITERKRTEEKLRESDDLFRSIFMDHTAVKLLIDASTGQILDANPAAIDFYGYTYDQLTALRIWDINTLDEQETLQHMTAARDGLTREFEFQHRLASGQLRRVHVFSGSIVVAGKTLLSSIIVDITDRHIAEAALRFTQFAIDHLGDMALWMNSSGRFTYVNDAACRLLGYSREELLTMSVPDIDPLYPKERWRENWDGLCQHKHQVIESRHQAKDGHTFPVEITDNLIEIDGQMFNCAIVRDITERKQAEEEHEKLQAQFAQAQKMESVGKLAGGVAHDFNNMLGVILGYTELALERVDPAQPLFAYLQEVRKAAKRSADLTQQLLAFARKQTVAPKELDLNETVSGMLKMLQRLIGEDIDLAWLPGKELGSVKVDPSQIDQILTNLCVNARDAIADVGKVTIETGAAAFDEAYCAANAGFVPGDYVLLAVSDNGCGMDQETLVHLFEPFFTTKEVGRGTGLGLAMVHGAVKQNNGFINVYSEPGQGTTFNIYLPRHEAKAQAKADAAAAHPARGSHETILLVEDDPAILSMITIMLEQLGYAVIAAKTPGEAIRLANEHAGEINLLITDVVMPEMNGRDLAANILSLYPGIKRLFMSGYTADVIAHHGVLEKGVNFIQKPFTMKNLAAKIREVLDRE
jgi:PAS domain S-box-containing protein